jgi:hypothetical protein
MSQFTYSVVVGMVLISSGSAVGAQDNIDLPLYVDSGDRLLIDYSLVHTNNGKSSTGKVSAEIVVGSINDESFLATWTTHKVEIGGKVIDSNSPQASSFLLGVPIEYVSAADGSPMRIADKTSFLETFLDSPVWKSMGPDAGDSARNFFNSLSEEALAQVLLKIPTYMSLCQSMSLPLGIQNDYAVQVPSPIGGEPVDSIVSYTLTAIDEQQENAHIDYTTSLDPESVKQLTIAMIEQFGSGEQPTPEEINSQMIERNESASCNVDIESGWVRTIRYLTETKVADQYKSERYDISVDYEASATY